MKYLHNYLVNFQISQSAISKVEVEHRAVADGTNANLLECLTTVNDIVMLARCLTM